MMTSANDNYLRVTGKSYSYNFEYRKDVRNSEGKDVETWHDVPDNAYIYMVYTSTETPELETVEGVNTKDKINITVYDYDGKIHIQIFHLEELVGLEIMEVLSRGLLSQL